VAPDGCPKVLDRDGDGIPDERDQCPDKPESKNNYEDDDGCPDVVPTAVKKFTGTIRGITFALNSAKILVASHKTLDAAVKVMTQYPKMKVRIDGHTDNIGSEAYNQDLSQRRAEAVRAYLVSKGVSADRLTVKGFGPDKPRANNASVRGRKLNRRIEFTLSQ
jgi:outer membrane protein OmpA-like peptidoglycan-associated protein